MFNFKKSKYLLILAIAAVLLSTVLSGCSSDSASSHSELKMHPASKLPDNVRQSPVLVREAYQFAVANPDLLQQVPCYCGCGNAGHDSNYECYVANAEANGEILYDYHGMYCGICVDITQDVMRLTAEGEAIQDIRTVIDQTYSQYGPSNMPPVE
jgi:hypothetical protein